MAYNFENLFPLSILMRGREYYEDGRVIDLENNNLNFEGTVSGTFDYQVIIEYNSTGSFDDMSCTCPYAEDHLYCKHMAAVLYAAENTKDITIEKPKSSHESIEKVIVKIDVNELREFLVKIMHQNELLTKNFKNYFSHYFDTISTSEYINQIDMIFSNYLGYNQFIEYHEAYDFYHELSNYFKSVSNLAYSKHKRIVFELIDYTLKKLAFVDSDDSLATTVDIADTLMDLLELLINETDPSNELYNELFQYVLALYKEPYIYMYDHRWDALFNDFFLEKEYLLKKLDFVDDEIEDIPEDKKKYISGPYIMKFDLIKALRYPVQDVIDFMSEYLENGDVALRLAQFYFEIEMFCEGIEIFNGLKDSNFNRYGNIAKEYLINYYTKHNKKDLLIKEIMGSLIRNNSDNYKYYLLLKKQYDVDEWQQIRKDVIKKTNLQVTDYLKILVEEEMYEELMVYFEDNFQLDLLRSYGKILKDKYPERILKLYEKKCKKMVQYTNGRRHYMEIAMYLKRMRKYPKGIKLVDSLIDQWLHKYKRRRAMKEEFLKVRS